MKKWFLITTMAIALLIAGCGEKNKALGTWYSVRDTLTLEKNGTYTSQWLTSGLKSTYSYDGNTYILSNPLQDKYKFEYSKTGGKRTLHYKSENSNLEYIYYDNKEDADRLKAEQAAAAQKEKEMKEAAAKEELVNNLVGIWDWGRYSNIEFTAAGEIKNYKTNIWYYEIVDSTTLKITTDTGDTYNAKIALTKTASGYTILFSNRDWTKRQPQ